METTILTSSKKLKSSNEPINGDIISNLPDSILHHILSFINLEHSAQTSVLSRRWRYLWTSLPTLKFVVLPRSIVRLPDKLKHIVDQALLRRDNSNVGRFELFYVDHTITTTAALDSWILYVLRRNVQEICLTLSFGILFRLPHCLFTSSSLTLLELSHSGTNPHKLISIPNSLLELSHSGKNPHKLLSLPNSISLPALKTLCLTGFKFEGYDVANNLFSNCPLLESLTIQKCEMHDTHIVISLLKLKHLVIKNAAISYGSRSPADGSLKLYAPNLLYFYCHDYFSINYLFENLPALVEAKIRIRRAYSNHGGTKETSDRNLMKFLASVQHVKALTLSASVIQVLSRAYDLLESSHILFCNLRCLKLERTLLSSDCIHAIAYLLKISPNVETLSLSIYEYQNLDDDEDEDEEEDFNDDQLEYASRDEINLTSTSTEDYLESGLSLQCVLHHLNLKYVEISISGGANELTFLEILLKNAMVLKKVVLLCSKVSPYGEPARRRWMMKFSERLLTFPTSAPRIAFFFI